MTAPVPMPSNPVEEACIHAAADALARQGNLHGWWPGAPVFWRELEPMGRSEFLGMVEDVVPAYRNGAPPRQGAA